MWEYYRFLGLRQCLSVLDPVCISFFVGVGLLLYVYNATKCLFITLGFFKLVNMYHLKAHLYFYRSADIEIRGPH